jgi:peptidoglycan/LPS O-acetylase OafA/YrhL
MRAPTALRANQTVGGMVRVTSSVSRLAPAMGSRGSALGGVNDQRSLNSQRFRGDIEGMRAIAIVVIVAYHAGLPGFTGGFIGVDIFFVISGFLITRNLIDESSSTNSIVLPRFWARRVRRLVPGLALMTIVTLVASSLIVAPFDMLQISKEGASAGLYVSNIVFGFKAQNYFASNINKSPFLHTWSLGVEEQFYLVWPFVLYAALLWSRRSGVAIRKLTPAIFVIILGTSFTINVVLTAHGSSWAFFSLPTRAWEFALGGLLASIAVRKVPLWCGTAVGIAGLSAIVYADLVFNDATPYPGTNALWPVVGAGLIILAGQTTDSSNPTAIMQLLGTRPMRWVGRLSYSWYLWHWPFIVLVVLALGNSSVSLRTAAAIASLGVAYVAFVAVENPIRFNPSLIRSSRRTFLIGVVITGVTLGTAGVAWEWATRQTPASYEALQSVAMRSFFPRCSPAYTPQGIYYCAGGDLNSSTVVALVGDSHAATWFNELSVVAARQHVRIAAFMTSGCPYIPIVVKPAIPNGPTSTSQCLAARTRGIHGVTELKPAGIILTEHDRQYLGLILDRDGSVPSEPAQVDLWRTAFKTFLHQMQDQGIRPGVILDDPTLPYEPAECVSRTQSLAACEASRGAALSTGQSLLTADNGVLKADPSVPVLAPDSFLCDEAGCPLELHGHLLYADTNHLTLGATQLMEPQLSQLLRSLTGG